jgi:hypothetical protein
VFFQSIRAADIMEKKRRGFADRIQAMRASRD